LRITILFYTLAIFCKGIESAEFVHKSYNFTNMNGENITIPCILNTSNNVQCHWLLNSGLKFPLENKYYFNRHANGDCSITISNLTMKEDDGVWQCQVYESKTLIAPPVRVTVLMPPEKPKILFNSNVPETGVIRIEANKTQKIECISMNGNPAAELKWILNSRPIEDRFVVTNISTDFVKSTLNYVFDKNLNGNDLICDSKHKLVNENEVVKLDIVYKPEVSINEQIKTIEVGGELRNVFCNVQANPPASIRWFDTFNPKIVFSEQSELLIQNINKDFNNKIYECIAENEVGRSNVASFKLNVLYEPSIISESANQRIKLGNRMQLECLIDANPPASINWFQSSLLTGETKKIQTESNDQSILLIKNITYQNEGNYYCEGSNTINGYTKVVRSRDINLQVYGIPGLINEKYITNGNLDSQSEIEFEFCANPDPDLVYWKADSCRLQHDLTGEGEQPDKGANKNCERYAISKLFRLLNQVSENGDLSNCYKTTLFISETKKEDEKEFQLVIRNREGTAEYSQKLNVTSPLSLFTLLILVILVFIILIALGFLIIVVLRRKHKGSENMNDDVLKEEAQTISHKGDLENGTSKTDFNQLNLNTSNDSYELVYANLDFQPRETQATEQLYPQNQMSLNLQQQQQLIQQPQIKNNHMKLVLPENKKQPPAIKPKPQLRPTPRQTNGTEYAKLTFNKADL